MIVMFIVISFLSISFPEYLDRTIEWCVCADMHTNFGRWPRREAMFGNDKMR
jgi:hypothetical protein